MTSCALAALLALLQITSACKNCVVLGKAEKAMFRAHSEQCLAQSHGVTSRDVAALLRGELADSASLRAHVYCVLRRCKLVAKDGKLRKAAPLGKLAARPDGRNATEVLESCAREAAAASPQDTAWNLFVCAYRRNNFLFQYMPLDKHSDDTA